MLSLYFNNVQIPDWIKVTDIKENILPSITADKYTTKFGDKKILITFKFKKNKLIDENKRKELLLWIRGNDFKDSKLVLPGRRELYYMAKVTNVSDITGSIRKGTGTIEFTCFKSEYINSIETIVNIDTNNKIKNIYYNGTADVYPTLIFKITSACTKVKLNFKNNKMNNFIEFNGSFNAGQTIILNQASNKVTLNEQLNMQIWSLLSKRNKLTNGENEYKLEVGNCAVEIKYNDEFM